MNREAADRRTGTVRRGREHSTSRQGLCKRGRPVPGTRVAASTLRRQRSWRASDRVVVPPKPGSAGGGKDPDFWHVSDANEEAVIGDEPANTRCGPDFAEETLRQGESRAGLALLSNFGPVVLMDFGPPPGPSTLRSPRLNRGTSRGLESQNGFVRATSSGA